MGTPQLPYLLGIVSQAGRQPSRGISRGQNDNNLWK
jgi:hypothetical protein